MPAGGPGLHPGGYVRRTATTPLTAEQHAAVLALGNMIGEEVNRIRGPAVKIEGRSEFEQEGFLAACIAVSKYDKAKHPNVPFEAYARFGIRCRLIRLAWKGKSYMSKDTWKQMPLTFDNGETAADDLADYRVDAGYDPLTEWCTEGARCMRRPLTWLQRVILYLRVVEEWTQQDVGDVWSWTRANVGVIETRIRERINEGK